MHLVRWPLAENAPLVLRVVTQLDEASFNFLSPVNVTVWIPCLVLISCLTETGGSSFDDSSTVPTAKPFVVDVVKFVDEVVAVHCPLPQTLTRLQGMSARTAVNTSLFASFLNITP